MTYDRLRSTMQFAILVLLASAGVAPAQSPRRTRNVVLIVSDGLRWQEIFKGADSTLMNRKFGHVEDTAALRREFARDDASSARAALFPFIWNVVAKRGEIFGNRTVQSDADVTNGYKFSYPGYNEMITGHPDPRINSNSAGPNPNLTVFEWLATRPGLAGRVAVFGTWDAFADIFNRGRSHLPIWAAFDPPPTATPPTPRDSLLTDVYATTTRFWGDLAYDSFMQAEVREYVARSHPRVMFVGYGETDEWAHMGRYDMVLKSAHQFDQFVADLWNSMQQIPQYRDSTTFIITADHGRGSGLTAWTDHGADVAGAEAIWIAVIGPDTPARGELSHVARVTQSQIAAAIASLLGENYAAAVPAAAAPLPVR
jgi:phosphopentomutase/2,3-bisphosphoglycerate-independent phosphoglycerate mutase family metalloenzyme